MIDDLLDFKKLFDEKERESKLSSIGVNSIVDTKQTISTGILSLDLITCGGLQRGRAYEIIGPEHGGKTTILYSCFGQALKCIPRKLKGVFLDIEGLVDPTWFGHITGSENMESVFGKKDSQGEWEIEPQIRYYKPSFGEQGLKFIKRMMKVMPDKVLVGDYWYYMWSPRAPKVVSKVGGWTIEELKKQLGDNYSKKLLAKYGNFYVPIDDNYGGPEMIIGVDSWVAMTPEAIAEEDSDAIASQARMFAKHLNDVKSLISAKGVVLVGINQIRMTPLSYGNPESTPGGNTLKHMTDVRIRIQAVSNQNGKGMTEEEDTDIYRHFKLKTIKNKTFIPFLEATGRWWVAHDGVSGYGPDPVIDILNYLKMTNQLKQEKSAFYIRMISKNEKLIRLGEIKFTYDKFKDFVLSKKVKGLEIDLKKMCHKQISHGNGLTLYLKRNPADFIEEKEDVINEEDES